MKSDCCCFVLVKDISFGTRTLVLFCGIDWIQAKANSIELMGRSDRNLRTRRNSSRSVFFSGLRGGGASFPTGGRRSRLIKSIRRPASWPSFGRRTEERSHQWKRCVRHQTLRDYFFLAVASEKSVDAPFFSFTSHELRAGNYRTDGAELQSTSRGH